MVNYGAESVAQTASQMEAAGLAPRIMIDFSHANSNKDYTRQALVCRDVAAQIALGDRRILGVMIESNLVSGAQKLLPGKPLIYGQSITDACIDWAETRTLLSDLAAAVRERRHLMENRAAPESSRTTEPVGNPFEVSAS
jgi:3-deoxy-7-phosphoheptulonate synthase